MIGIGVLLAIVGYVHCQATQEVAFSVGLSKSTSYLAGSRPPTVIFDTEFSNAGSGFDLSTGIFTCPEAGIYLFQFHSLSHDAGSTWLELWKNDQYVQSIFGRSPNDYASAGNSVILKVNHGDTLEVKARTDIDGYQIHVFGTPTQIYNTFSGYLLEPILSGVPVGK